MNDWLNVLMLIVLPFVAVVFAGLAAMMFLANLRLFHRDRDDSKLSESVSQPVSISVSVLIPARDEANSIERAIRAVLAIGERENENITIEVVVLDDGSTDGTGAIVRALADEDDRVRLIEGIALPEGWNGKQHACYRLAEQARYDHLLFLDADVRLEATAIRRLLQRKVTPRGPNVIALLSAFPRQETGTILEKMLIPMMHFILLCYLPFARMRGSTHPAYASGCGQLFLTDRESYVRAGTHQAIRASRHDGLKLPMIYRQNGMLTDCIDGTEIATCRMYASSAEVIRGLLKNANEGIANARLLIPFTVLLGLANLLPWVTLVYGFSKWNSQTPATYLFTGLVFSVMAIAISYVPRLTGMMVLRQSVLGAIFHPLAILIFLLIQWWAFGMSLSGKQVAWRGRVEKS